MCFVHAAEQGNPVEFPTLCLQAGAQGQSQASRAFVLQDAGTDRGPILQDSDPR